MVACSEITTMLAVQLEREPLTAGGRTYDDYRCYRLHEAELVENLVLSGSLSAAFDVSHQNCVVAMERVLDAHAVVV